ncbi:hypothetical protein B0T20DRAFT_33444 [Sordaria brevicollis]|uniref:Uncharacterized protein n=1 Tax=Sordaria brevicollis TaxID=83679 RepID=A0AAE0U952_SORBR|nr:hypothetical protein B0T20DRAFT_33444 [Sordaria brevicollis]
MIRPDDDRRMDLVGNRLEQDARVRQLGWISSLDIVSTAAEACGVGQYARREAQFARPPGREVRPRAGRAKGSVMLLGRRCSLGTQGSKPGEARSNWRDQVSPAERTIRSTSECREAKLETLWESDAAMERILEVGKAEAQSETRKVVVDQERRTWDLEGGCPMFTLNVGGRPVVGRGAGRRLPKKWRDPSPLRSLENGSLPTTRTVSSAVLPAGQVPTSTVARSL